MKLVSNMKKCLGEELMRLCGAVCDSRKYDSNQEKMIAVSKLLKMYDVEFSILGGATNRLSVLIDGYAYKFALDNQGYRDNFIEYSLSSELQPFATRTYETNGYILVAEYVNQMTMEIWKSRKDDIIKILSMLAQDYLLGDVGYTGKNYMNWGTRDDGSLVILDYAYCHRATETLFKCDKCGEGLLTYDVNYTMLMCTNRANGCNARYSYNDRKNIQGDQVDIDMIEDMKNNHSVALEQGVLSKEVELLQDSGEVYSDDVVLIHNAYEYRQFQKEEEETVYKEDYDQAEALDLLVDIARAKADGDEEEAETLVASLSGKSVQRRRPPRRAVFAEDYELDASEVKYDGIEGPDQIVYYDSQYLYPNSYESLGFDDAAALKKEFYRERTKIKESEDSEMSKNVPVVETHEATVDDLIDLLRKNSTNTPQMEEPVNDNLLGFMDVDGIADRSPWAVPWVLGASLANNTVVEPANDEPPVEKPIVDHVVTAKVLVDGIPVEG